MSYLEGCTAPMRDENQLHAAVVELVALDDAEIKYSTVQNWYPGDAEGKGGIFNFVTKRGDCRGARSKISWTQVETGSAITWKYPSCILRGDNSRGEFYSIAISNGHQQVDSGTKMLHLGKNTTSRIISKGIAAGKSNNTYRGLVTAHRKATNARNFTNCDSLLIGTRLRRTHRALYRGEEFIRRVRARGNHLEDFRGHAVLLPPTRHVGGGGDCAGGQRLRQGRAAAAADGIRGRSTETHLNQSGGERRMSEDIKKLKAGALTCIGQDKPASELVEYINTSFEDIRAHAEEDDLVVRGGERNIVVKRIVPDKFHVAKNVAIPSTNLVDHGGGVERNLEHLLHEIAVLAN